MASFLKNIKSTFFTSGKKNVLILGYKTAGKSTIVDQLFQNRILRQRRDETHGTKVKNTEIQLGSDTHEFRITDVGGSKQYQDMFWKAEIAKADGIIYVVDSSVLYECDSGTEDPDRCPNYIRDNKIINCGCLSNRVFRESRMAKSYCFSILDKGKPILIFLNKMDLSSEQRVYSIEEMRRWYNIMYNSTYNTRVESGSALTGENVIEAISWLFDNMS